MIGIRFSRKYKYPNGYVASIRVSFMGKGYYRNMAVMRSMTMGISSWVKNRDIIWIMVSVDKPISAISFDTMLSVLSVGNLFAVVMIVLGAVIGAAVFGWLVGFYPIESGITAGLCMGLMGYAQISSRIGGAIILLIGSIAFSFVG